MTQQEVLALYEKTGALMRGHFRLSSGLHSAVYLQSALVLQYPEHATALGADLAAAFGPVDVATVLAPAIGGIIVAHEVARALGARALFAEREGGIMTLRRGFSLGPGERCLVVEDVITTGGSTLEVVECAQKAGAVVVGVGALIDRSGGTTRLPMPPASLARVDAVNYRPEECPLCATGSQPIKPGSRSA